MPRAKPKQAPGKRAGRTSRSRGAVSMPRRGNALAGLVPGALPEVERALVNREPFQQAQQRELAAELGQVRGNQSLQRTMRARASGAVRRPVQGKRVIQRFGSLEHKKLGDEGSGGREYVMGSAPGGAVPFKLTQGDLTMLSGDYFDPRDTTVKDGVEQPNPDSLFRLAATPSSDPGKVVQTQDEIIAAIYSINPNDPRFAKQSTPAQPTGGVWAGIEFSKEVKEAVQNRYLRLASVNQEHFAAPRGVEGGPASGNRASAGGSYRALHEEALLRAFFAGQAQQDAADGLMREAAAQHFLTDNFAAGHLRTPRALINEYWHGKYPLFFGNLKKKIALDVARYMNANSTNIATVFGTVSAIYDSAYDIVLKQTANLPEIGFGDLVSGVAHDVDNATGLWVINDIGQTWKTFGDSNLENKDPDNRTPEMAELAVRLGISDVEHAHRLGQIKPGPWSDDAILAQVRAMTESPAVPGTKYAAEQVLPHVDPNADNGTQTWQAASLDDLWGMPVRTGGETYGQRLIKSAQSGDIHEQLADVAKGLDEDMSTHASTLHPKEAFIEGFMKPLADNPLVGLRSIIDYNPSEGQVFFNTDDAVMEEMDTMSPEDIKGFTTNQRADRIKNLISGYTAGDEEDRVIELFETAPASERAQIYRLVEGHAWTGDWIEGFFVDDDDIWNALSRGNLKRLRTIINGQ